MSVCCESWFHAFISSKLLLTYKIYSVSLLQSNYLQPLFGITFSCNQCTCKLPNISYFRLQYNWKMFSICHAFMLYHIINVVLNYILYSVLGCITVRQSSTFAWRCTESSITCSLTKPKHLCIT